MHEKDWKGKQKHSFSYRISRHFGLNWFQRIIFTGQITLWFFTKSRQCHDFRRCRFVFFFDSLGNCKIEMPIDRRAIVEKFPRTCKRTRRIVLPDKTFFMSSCEGGKNWRARTTRQDSKYCFFCWVLFRSREEELLAFEIKLPEEHTNKRVKVMINVKLQLLD